MIPDILSHGQYSTVYNFLSLVIASQLFTALFLLISLPRILPRYRQAITVAIMVCGIAAYHYFRIFDSFKESFVTKSVGGTGDYTQAVGTSFNEGYRYVDWLLTVPLLLVELVAVLALAQKVQNGLLMRLVPASALMIILGYPGELATDTTTRLVWGTLSTIPFIYLLYVLFVELSKSLDRQPLEVRGTVSKLRIMLVGLWGVYPIAYLFPVFGFNGANAFVARQIGYSLADIFAKAAFGLVILKIARLKSEVEDPSFAAEESNDTVVAAR